MIHIEKNCIPDNLKKTIICIYGGGYTGKVIINLFRRNGLIISNIIDDDIGLQNSEVEGIKVISFDDFCRIYKNEEVSIVLTSIYGKAILRKIEKCQNIKIYELFDWYSEIIGNKEWIGKITKDEDLFDLKQQWELIRKNLEDKESIDVLEGLWKYFNTKDLQYIEKICTDADQYFIPEVIDSIKEPLHIIDAGAYRGELLHSIKKNNLCLEKWYCFEPDEENFTLLIEQERKNEIRNVQTCIKKGLWNKELKVFFEGGNSTGSRIVPYETKEYIEVISIDEFIKTGRCNFIKMDIEGAELEALKGGINTIKRERPILAICIYHSLQDFWKIPQYLMEKLEEYSFFVRHHALICNETVLYAIPK